MHLDQILRQPLRYSYFSGPDVVRSWHDAQQRGVNCAALVHILGKEFLGVELPWELMGFELIYDQCYLRDLQEETPQKGDILIVGRGIKLDKWEREYRETGRLRIEKHPRVHLAMHTGQFATVGDPFLIHATPYDGGGIRLWPLSYLTSHPFYSHIYKWRRIHEHHTS